MYLPPHLFREVYFIKKGLKPLEFKKWLQEKEISAMNSGEDKHHEFAFPAPEPNPRYPGEEKRTKWWELDE